MSKNQANTKNKLSNLSINYVLKRIFSHLTPIKVLKYIQYNKNLQSRLNKDINDYKKENLKVIIEIIPEENQYGKFINLNPTEKSFCHFYSNNNKEEMKKNKISDNEKIQKIKIEIESESNIFPYLFNKCH